MTRPLRAIAYVCPSPRVPPRVEKHAPAPAMLRVCVPRYHTYGMLLYMRSGMLAVGAGAHHAVTVKDARSRFQCIRAGTRSRPRCCRCALTQCEAVRPAKQVAAASPLTRGPRREAGVWRRRGRSCSPRTSCWQQNGAGRPARVAVNARLLQLLAPPPCRPRRLGSENTWKASSRSSGLHATAAPAADTRRTALKVAVPPPSSTYTRGRNPRLRSSPCSLRWRPFGVLGRHAGSDGCRLGGCVRVLTFALLLPV